MKLAPSYPVRSRRLLLRPLEERDVDALVSYRSLPEVCRYIPGEPMGEQKVVEYLHGRWARHELDAAGQGLVLGAELRDGGELVGDLMLYFSSEEHRSGEIGYVFNPHHSGRGYATEAAHLVLHLAFDKLGLHRVVARIDTENEASARLATRLGMRREAHLVENEWFKGRWSDEYDFALLEQEWTAMHENGCPGWR
jgi:RimJ/RimL family protein N-acetyltransferase